MKSVVRMPANAKRVTRAALVLVCAAAMLVALTGQALAKKPTASKSKITPTTPITKGSTYLALGDSVTFGYEEPTVVPAPNYPDAASFLGYPELSDPCCILNVVNAACPGETSTSLIDNTAQSNGCENTPGKGNVGYRTLYPLHASYSGSQLAFAVSYLKKHKNVRLVSLMIGANDYFVCQETTADQCASLTEQAAVLETLGKNVHTILSEIRNKAHYNGQVAIVNYYSVDAASATANGQSALLNRRWTARPSRSTSKSRTGSARSRRARRTRAAIAPAPPACSRSSAGARACGIHPSYAGASLLALALEKVTRFQ